jgi:hypothetical protein
MRKMKKAAHFFPSHKTVNKSHSRKGDQYSIYWTVSLFLSRLWKSLHPEHGNSIDFGQWRTSACVPKKSPLLIIWRAQEDNKRQINNSSPVTEKSISRLQIQKFVVGKNWAINITFINLEHISKMFCDFQIWQSKAKCIISTSLSWLHTCGVKNNTICWYLFLCFFL